MAEGKRTLVRDTDGEIFKFRGERGQWIVAYTLDKEADTDVVVPGK